MSSLHFDRDAWEDFLFWLASDRKMARRIARLIAEIQRDPFAGIAARMTAEFRAELGRAVDSGAYADAAAEFDRTEGWDA